MIVAFSVVPLDKGESLSEYVSKIIDLIDQCGLPYRLTPMNTIVEGSWDDVMGLIRRCHELMMEDSRRVYTCISIDDRKDRRDAISRKIESIEKKLGRGVRDFDDRPIAGATVITSPLRPGSGSGRGKARGRRLMTCGRRSGMTHNESSLPEYIGRVATTLPSCTSSDVTSAIAPASYSTATVGANSRPRVVAPKSITAGWCSAACWLNRVAYGSTRNSANVASSARITRSAPY